MDDVVWNTPNRPTNTHHCACRVHVCFCFIRKTALVAQKPTPWHSEESHRSSAARELRCRTEPTHTCSQQRRAKPGPFLPTPKPCTLAAMPILSPTARVSIVPSPSPTCCRVTPVTVPFLSALWPLLRWQPSQVPAAGFHRVMGKEGYASARLSEVWRPRGTFREQSRG